MIRDTSLAAMLDGREPPGGPAAELRPLAQALAGLRGHPAGDELAGEAEALAAFRNHFGAPYLAHRPSSRGRPVPRFVPVKAGAAAIVTVLSLGGFVTAAYARALPTAVQRLAHDIIGAPAPGAQPAFGPSGDGPAASGDAGNGLCTAWAHAKAHGTGKQRALAFRRLAAAAGGAGNVTGYCAAGARPGTSPSPTPAPAPHGTGRPPALPAPHGTGRPSGLPAHRTGTPTIRPTPHSTGRPSELPTPRGTRSPTAHPG